MNKEKKKKEKRKKNKKDNSHHPLFLPQGSIRAILVLILTVFLGFCIWWNRDIPEDVAVVWLSLVSYYVGTRINR